MGVAFQQGSSMILAFKLYWTLLYNLCSFVLSNSDMIGVMAHVARIKKKELYYRGRGWAAGCHRSQEWVQTSRVTFLSNYSFVMASRLLRIGTWSAEDDTWYLWYSVQSIWPRNIFVHAGFQCKKHCWNMLMECDVRGAWELLPASINDVKRCDYARKKVSMRK